MQRVHTLQQLQFRLIKEQKIHTLNKQSHTFYVRRFGGRFR